MWLSHDQVLAIGFHEVDEDVQIDSRAIFINAQNISIGRNSRIDAFVLLSAGSGTIIVGKHVHIASGAKLYGNSGIEIQDFAGLSVNSVLLSESDDFLIGNMTNPTIPSEFRHVSGQKIVLERHALVGAGSVLLPGSSLGLGSCLGALSTLNKKTEPFSIWSGTPSIQIGKRPQEKLLATEARFELSQKLRTK